MTISLHQFTTDPKLCNLDLSPAQGALLKAFDRDILTDEEQAIFRECVGRDYEPRTCSELTVIAGARSGKDSRIAAPNGLYEAYIRDHSYLAPGERGYVLIVAQDSRAGQVPFNYMRATIENSPMLRSSVLEFKKTEIVLDNNITIAVYPCNYRAPRGITIICAIADEVAFWRDETSANPDVEIIRAMRRGMANVPTAKLIKISTPYAKSGVLYDDFTRRDSLTDTLLWVSPTWLMNPSVPSSFLDREREKDPVAFQREFGAEFSEDVATFIPAEVIAGAVRDYRELPPIDSVTFYAGCDPAGGGADAFTASVAHQDGERIVVDWVRGWRATKPESVVSEIAGLLRPYGIQEISGDRYSGAWVRNAFERHGISYNVAEKNRSELYLELLPALNQGRVDLPNEPTLIRELKGLERRTSRSGRDSIDHGIGGHHDDYANAVAVVVASLEAPAWELAPLFSNDDLSDVIWDAYSGSYVPKPKPAAKFVATKKLWLTRDRRRLVADGDPEAASLFCIPGRECELTAEWLVQVTRDGLMGNEEPNPLDEPIRNEEAQPETMGRIAPSFTAPS